MRKSSGPAGDSESSVARRRFVKLSVVLGVCHYFASLLIDGLIFFISRIPPKAVNLDGLILVLLKAHQVLHGPQLFLEWLWPFEYTPPLFGLALTILNSAIWGVALAFLKIALRR